MNFETHFFVRGLERFSVGVDVSDDGRVAVRRLRRRRSRLRRQGHALGRVGGQAVEAVPLDFVLLAGDAVPSRPLLLGRPSTPVLTTDDSSESPEMRKTSSRTARQSLTHL